MLIPVLWIFDDVSSNECSWQQIWKFIIIWMYSRHSNRRCISHDLHSLTSLLLMKASLFFAIPSLISALNDNFLQTIDDGLWWCSNLLKFTVVLWYLVGSSKFFHVYILLWDSLLTKFSWEKNSPNNLGKSFAKAFK